MDDKTLMKRTIELALLAEEEGNLPVGSLLVKKTCRRRGRSTWRVQSLY